MADNTFATAKDLSISIGDTTRTVTGRGRLGKADPIDIVKFTLLPGGSIRSIQGSLSTRGGGLRVTGFLENPLTGQILSLTAPQRFKPGTTNSREQFVGQSNPFPGPVNLYIRFDRPTQNLRYRFNINYTTLS
jgi:hypothetical protein